MAWKKKLVSMKHVTDYLKKKKGIELNFLRLLRETIYLIYYQWTFYLNCDISFVIDNTSHHPQWTWHITSFAVNMNGKPKCLNDHYPRFSLPILTKFQSVSKLLSSSRSARKRLWVTCLPQEILNNGSEWFDFFWCYLPTCVGCSLLSEVLRFNNLEQSFLELALSKSRWCVLL